MEKIFEWSIHHLPFFALMSTPKPENRPLATRLLEQTLVGIIASIIGASGALYIENIRQEEQLKTVNSTLMEIRVELIESRKISTYVAVQTQRLDELEKRLDRSRK